MRDTPLTSKNWFTPEYMQSVVKELETRGWRPDSRGDPECCDEAIAASAQIIERLQRENLAIRTALELAREVIRIKSTAPEQSARQFPIAAIRVGEHSSELLHLYAPGLPPGEHDLYCEPVTQLPKTGNADELCNAQTQRPRETAPEAALPAPPHSPTDPLTIPDALRKAGDLEGDRKAQESCGGREMIADLIKANDKHNRDYHFDSASLVDRARKFLKETCDACATPLSCDVMHRCQSIELKHITAQQSGTHPNCVPPCPICD